LPETRRSLCKEPKVPDALPGSFGGLAIEWTEADKQLSENTF